MKSVALVVLAWIFSLSSFAQNYQPVADKSSVKFTIKNFGVNIKGDFKGPSGTISFDPADLSKAAFDVSIDASSINTDNDSRDKHLREEDYFSVKEYPRISFKSEKVEAAGKGAYTLKGKLTIKATTKDISIPFTATAQGSDWLFEGSFKINRRDYKVGGNSVVLSDDLTVSLSVVAAKK